MVQMKAIILHPPLFIALHFISHMVQMKEGEQWSIIRDKKLLYIPHGSDESPYRQKAPLYQQSLYPTWFR